MNEEILGGIKSAVNRGETLQEAMMTFFNAGYKKEDIEEAARVFQQENIKINPIYKEKKKIPKPKKISNKKVSSYGVPKKKDKTKTLLLRLIVITSIIFVLLLLFFFLTK